MTLEKPSSYFTEGCSEAPGLPQREQPRRKALDLERGWDGMSGNADVWNNPWGSPVSSAADPGRTRCPENDVRFSEVTKKFLT